MQIGKLLMIAGGVILIIGILFYFFDKIPLLGKLPGDILIKKKNYTIYFPLATSILLSLFLSLILYLIYKFR